MLQEIPENAVVWRVPRSREVGQSYAAALIPTARAILASVWLVSRLQPDVILCNGPGTCLPICLAAAVLRGVGWLRTRIVFVESVCRVNDLSATGKLLYYVADQVQVQWPELLRRYVQIGAERGAARRRSFLSSSCACHHVPSLQVSKSSVRWASDVMC